MKIVPVSVLILAFLALTGCGIGESRVNPFNWFDDRTEDEPADVEPAVTITDPRPLVAKVTDLALDETPGGIIVRAVGLPPTQGWHSAALVSQTRGRAENGVLTFAFRVAPPVETQPVSTAASREIFVGRFVSELTLRETREIRIIAENNVLVVRP